METTYRVRGADGQSYGPATLEQLQGWIDDGRVGPNSQIQRGDQSNWVAASALPELQFVSAPPPSTLATTAPTTHQPGAVPEEMKWVASFKSGASWFYWIAGLSLINSFASLSGSGWGFIAGLGITQLFDGLGSELGNSGKVVVLLLDLAVAGVFVMFGVFANRGHAWAFVVGMILYALDGLLFLVAQAWLGLGFHVFVLFCLGTGFAALRRLRASATTT